MDLEITQVEVGMREFEGTAIYPEYLLFNLPGTRLNWTIGIETNLQEGVLKSKGKVLYEYHFDGNWCKFRKTKEYGSF